MRLQRTRQRRAPLRLDVRVYISAMIDESNAKNWFLAACPSFEVRFQEMKAEWSTEALSLYNVLSELAEHLVREVGENRTKELSSCLAVVEKLLESGSASVKSAVTAGFLEDLQNTAKENGLMPEVFEPMIGKHTKRWWNDLCKNWAAQTDW